MTRKSPYVLSCALWHVVHWSSLLWSSGNSGGSESGLIRFGSCPASDESYANAIGWSSERSVPRLEDPGGMVVIPPAIWIT